MKSNKNPGILYFFQRILRYICLLLFIILSAWLSKSILFSVHYIPSSSMMPALGPGNYVLVSNYSYNLRTPEYYPLTDIPFPSFFVGGLGEVNQGDIVVFDLPVFPPSFHQSQKENYIKRSVGLPGDTVLLADDYYYLQKNYTYNSKKEDDLSANNYVEIPKKGTWISLSDSIKSFWKPILILDGNEVTYDSSGHTIVNGDQLKRYQVQQDYYFLRGDNARLSSDSRLWGLVPKSYLIGRAEAVIWPWPPKWL